MTDSPRLQALEARHELLDQRLHAIMTRPHWDSLEASRIKREKLVVKEAMEELKEYCAEKTYRRAS